MPNTKSTLPKASSRPSYRFPFFNIARAAILASALFVSATTQTALAQSTQTPNASPSTQAPAVDRCLALANRGPQRDPLFQRASVRNVALKPYQAQVSFLGHATFLIESPKGVKIATDYAVAIPPPNIPNIATMNIAHSSHYTNTPQKEIAHVLPGWNDAGGPAVHDVTVEDVRTRNVPTNIRSWSGDTREFGNSIFIFEIGPICMAHLGHLHHPLTTQQLANVGQMDVVMAPVDGSYTLDTPGMIEVLKAMNPRIIFPMHYFTEFSLQRFLSVASQHFTVRRMDVPTFTVSKDALPLKPEIIVLPGH
ncbi:MAG: MBL fold metallo-hydrolase [Pseudomonadota bacterium]